MRILVTGGNGHVGGSIKKHLAELDFDVFDVSRTGQIRDDISSPGFAKRVAQKIKTCDVIVHAAANLSKCLTDCNVSATNCSGVQEIIHLADLLAPKKIVFISSVQVIGIPIFLPVDESHPTNPLTAYHASKLFGEHLMQIANGIKIKTISLRITSPVGPCTPPGRIFSEFVYRAKNNLPIEVAGRGGRCQNYIDVRDIAIAVVQCFENDLCGVFNLAGAKSISNIYLANLCRDSLSSKSQIVYSGFVDPDELIAWDVSYKKAHDCFGFSPKYNIEDSIFDFAKC